ncbi:hypothetical protein ALC57_04035 [Trachymyrmex cornetzi]|uniref:Uncharacterized protein n=1 Tax=Trachymyrmex cornetzi TaxID=471704 RepID=A0A151JFF9_9HYME|nr:hypothetical protein ALC57_04035 [Trachymyrmex cornetzi]
MTDPQVHYIEYPLSLKVRCLKCAKCFGDEGVGKVKGEYSDLPLKPGAKYCDSATPYLSKHLKKYHPGDTISYRCSLNVIINLKENNPYKDVKTHFTKFGTSLPASAAGQSTRGSLGECNSVGKLRTSGAAKATSRLAETVEGPDKRRAATSGSRRLTLPFTAAPSPSQAANEARAQGRTSTTPTSRSPSYAAVTAGPSTRSTTFSTTARSKTVAKTAAPTTTTREARRSGEAAAMRKSPRTATVSKPRVMSVKIMNLPPTTRGSLSGSPGEKLISFSPATSLPTTFTTCTVTTTTCGSPIISTGFIGGVGRQITPPSCLPQWNILPTIGEEKTSPCVAVTTLPIGGFRTSPLIQPRPTTPETCRSRDYPAPATVARQCRRERVAARNALLDRAKDVATIADLEAFAASIAAFFGEDASTTGAAARARDRSARSREADAHRGARGGEPPKKEGASGPGSASAGPGASGEVRGDWVREAKRLQALYRANRRKAVREVLQGPANRCGVPKRRSTLSTYIAARMLWPALASAPTSQVRRRCPGSARGARGGPSAPAYE